MIISPWQSLYRALSFWGPMRAIFPKSRWFHFKCNILHSNIPLILFLCSILWSTWNFPKGANPLLLHFVNRFSSPYLTGQRSSLQYTVVCHCAPSAAQCILFYVYYKSAPASPFLGIFISALFVSPNDPKYRLISPLVILYLKATRFRLNGSRNRDLCPCHPTPFPVFSKASLFLIIFPTIFWNLWDWILELNPVLLLTYCDHIHRKELKNIQMYQITSNSKSLTLSLCQTLQSQVCTGDLRVSRNLLLFPCQEVKPYLCA